MQEGTPKEGSLPNERKNAVFTDFYLPTERELQVGNYNTYIHPSLHPERTMREHDFVYLLEGGWSAGQNGQVYRLEKDQVLLLTGGQHHKGVEPCLPGTRTIFLHGVPDENDRFRGKGEAPFLSPDWVSLPPLIPCEGRPEIRELFEKIVAELWNPGSHSASKLSALFRLLLCALSDAAQWVTRPKNNTAERALAILRKNPQKCYTVEELAGQVFVSGKTLETAVKKRTGKTLHRWQMDTKLEMASFELRMHPQMRLRELALNFGFYDEFHFSRLFKAKYGVSPREYRSRFSEES